MNNLFILVVLLLLISCSGNNENILNIPEYEGPISEVYDATHYYSDSAVVKLKIETPVQWDFENGDQEFPEGIFIEFFDNLGQTTNTLRADHCKYTFEDKVYKATGNVVMKGIKTNEQLNTEELFWDMDKERVYTDKFVMIETENQIVKGNGLESNQDFTEWEIKNSVGTISLDDK